MRPFLQPIKAVEAASKMRKSGSAEQYNAGQNRQVITYVHKVLQPPSTLTRTVQCG